MTDAAIAVLPYMGARLGAKLAELSLDELRWPLGRPARLKEGVVRNLTSDDHLIVYPRNAMHFQLNWGTRAKVSVIVAEPAMIHGRHLKMLRLTYRRFYRVLSYDDALLAAIPNGIRHPFGATWVSTSLSKAQAFSRLARKMASQVLIHTWTLVRNES